MSLASLKSKVRAFAQVESGIVSQSDTGDGGANLDSGETLALLDALTAYNLARPRQLVVSGSAIASGYDQALTSLVAAWAGDTHRALTVWFPLDGQERNEMLPADWQVYQKPDGSWHVRFIGDVPSEPWYLDFTAPHVVDTVTDTLSSEAPLDVDAVCHLAASNVLQMAANKLAKQSSTSLSADTISAENQSRNYAMRAKEEREKFTAHMASRAGSSQGMVDWGRPAAGQADRFWRGRRYQ